LVSQKPDLENVFASKMYSFVRSHFLGYKVISTVNYQPMSGAFCIRL